MIACFCLIIYISFLKFLVSISKSHGEGATDVKDNPNAYFICLVATSNKGFPEKESYLYDIATEMELQGFQVKFLSTDDLKKFYMKYHPNYDENEVNVYEMAYFFIKMHHGSAFFFDEVPFIQPKKGNNNYRYTP